MVRSKRPKVLMSKEKRNFTTRVKYVREKGNELGEKGV